MITERLLAVVGISAAALTGLYIFWGPNVDLKYRRRKNTVQIPGLTNLGNTCFLNAVLQALASCPSFVQWLSYLSGKIHSSETDETEDSAELESQYLCHALLKTMRVLNDNKPTGFISAYSPTDVINSLKANRWVISTEEQDAYELYFVLLSTLDEEMIKTELPTSLADVSAIVREDFSDRDPRMIYRHLGDKVQTSPFKGLLANQLMCRNCGYKYPVKCDTFDSLSLTIPTSSLVDGGTVYNCIRHFVNPEIVTNVDCDNCPKMFARSKRSSFVKQLTICRLPITLCIHIQRTLWLDNGMPMKRAEYVNYPEYLCMDPYLYDYESLPVCSGILKTLVGGCSSNLQNSLHLNLPYSNIFSRRGKKIAGHTFSSYKYVYKLQAVIVHLGDVFSGHFVTYRRGQSQSNRWFVTSDSDVREVSAYDVMAAPAYVLFYEKVNGI